ncbi:hypothetical protein MJO28_005792 [Puccinia striiformis f. sp. tritici]|uniref:Uncharacterized protein n=1 Tax=Puccinia striiformis f. sp. tritici TaxID=168172 RepID=A0ACC0EMX8_9BASI|nr:hypothetical protein MJO28_005792 [Puccinia striiformis f. sp. tritici]
MCIEHTPPISEISEKLLYIGKVIAKFNLDPKRYITAFLQNQHKQIVLHHRLWGAQIGWRSTLEVLHTIKGLVCKTTEGKSRWSAYILSEAQEILAAEGGSHGQFPAGTYYNSSKITPQFFYEEAKSDRVARLVREDMPFLYNLIKNKINQNQMVPKVKFGGSDSGSDVDEPSQAATRAEPTPDIEESSNDEIHSSKRRYPQAQDAKDEIYDRTDRPHVISATICAMVSFATNRRDNALQIQNSVVLLACGVTERVNTFLNYIGLSSSRRTAHRALRALGIINERKIIRIMSDKKSPLAPIICMDNIDFKESVHKKSVEKTSQMIHGTWGYLHVVDQELLEKFNLDDFSIDKYNQSILESETMPLKPSTFLPTQSTSCHFRAVIKSQITRVLLKYIAEPKDTMVELRKDPPEIDPIAVKKPNITMLKLMVASDNSAEGMGEVFESIMRQTGLTPTEFFSRLRVFEGDLGTCMNLESLRKQRKPSGHLETSLASCFTLLGASHILWNVAQAIYLMHYGNPQDSNNLGAWQTLSSLGVPAKKPTTKKDFSLMITNLTKSHEASILYCLLTVMGYSHALLPDKKVTLPSQKLEDVVDECYTRFFLPAAFDALDDDSDDSDASEDSQSSTGNSSHDSSNSGSSEDSQKPAPPPVLALKNLLLRLRDFASIVECD